MLEMFRSARWDQAYDFLSSGDPPVMFRLLAINTLFMILFVMRRVRTPHRMKESAVMQVQALLLGANCLILFQNEVQRNAQWAFDRVMASF
jgi:hypothetical protein